MLNHVVDPTGTYYGLNKTAVDQEIESNMGNKVAALYNYDIAYHKNEYKFDQYLQSFILGSTGYISNWDKEKNTDSELVFRGVGSDSQKALKHCWKTGRTFYAIDTGYFGNFQRKVWHRITKNNLQQLGPIKERPSDRLKKIINYKYKNCTSGRKILICPPSDKVMNLFNQPDPETWTNQTINELKKYTDRPIEIRLKPNRTERVTTKTIEAALADDVYCLITYNSIAAIEALMNGKPAIALGPNAAQSICNTKISDIENLRFPCKDEMTAFMCHLSYCQFNKEEMINGTAWRILNEDS